MKKKNVILAMVIVSFILIRCNNSSGLEPAPSVSLTDSGHTHKMISVKDSADYVSKTIRVTGDVQKELRLTVDSLKNMKAVTLDEFNVVCQSGATVKTDKSSKGVLLKDILEKAVIRQANHKDRNFIIVARASDGYKATFSWAELFNNPTGENTYVLFEENGKPIVSKGNMILICTNDIKTGPRHVNWLKSIEVTKVN